MDEAVLVLRRERWNEALHVQADAFSEDQLIGHWAIGGRDQRERERRVRRLFELFKGTASFEHAEIHMLGDASASAIWLRPPGHFRRPLLSSCGCSFRCWRCSAAGRPELWGY